MKTTKIISMMEFEEAIGQIAKKAKKDYYNVECHIQNYAYSEKAFTFKAYIDGYKHISGKTPNEVIVQMKKFVNPPKQVIKEVLI